MDYWYECISEALDEAGISATHEQINLIVGAVEGAHENYGMAHGHDTIPNPLVEENQRLRRALQEEEDKTTCAECNGRGRIITRGPYHGADSECSKCRGRGRV